MSDVAQKESKQAVLLEDFPIFWIVGVQGVDCYVHGGKDEFGCAVRIILEIARNVTKRIHGIIMNFVNIGSNVAQT
jgi:hypothetical protein